ncbi:MAG: porphobilinogen synthase [Candidatus Omnitrophota bacterium]|nr:porphobilinogen synthase [Candidatus Omnitrophota bacterium]
MRERRKDAATRKKYRQTPELSAKDLIMPIFVKEGISAGKEIRSMPGIYQLPLKDVTAQARKVYDSGIPAVILFGIPEHKDEMGSSAYVDKGIVQEAIYAIKKKVPGLCVIADVCLCEYTSHGHCGIIKESPSPSPLPKGERAKKNPSPLPRGERIKVRGVDNDETIKILAKVAVSYAKAGVDTVAPSAMMDGQVKAIKEALLKNNYPEVKIMSYSAKYASGFYAPFRDAAESPPRFGDRKTYQMDYHNSDEAVLEARLDIEEGADILMVKPALGYEDIIYRIKKELKFPLACYSVSGEYSMIKAAGLKGYIDEEKIVLETLTGFKRAGADTIITYYALETAGWLKNKKQT